MASNLNKAFMRAYAKERPGTPEAAPPAATPSVSTPQVTTPLAAVSPNVVSSGHDSESRATVRVPVTAPTSPARPTLQRQDAAPTISKMPNQSMPMQSMPTQSMPTKPMPNSPGATPVLRGRHVAPTTAQHVPPMNTQPVNTQPTNFQPVNNSPATTRPVSTRPASTPQPIAPQPIAQAASAPPANARRDAGPQIHAQASGVWQRIDQAQGSPTPHPQSSSARPTATVGAVAGPPARRLQAAAAAPKPLPTSDSGLTPAMSAAATLANKIGDSDEELPVISDQELALVDRDSLQAKRRTVADFLYAAGQYTPGRILASHNSHPANTTHTANPAHATNTVHASNNASIAAAQPAMNPAVHSQPAYAQPAMSQPVMTQPAMTQPAMSQPAMSQPAMAQAGGMSKPAMNSATGGAVASAVRSSTTLPAGMPSQMPAGMPHEASIEPAMAEPMPRRMGQILRVDLPRGAQTTSAANSSPASAQSMNAQAMNAQATNAQALNAHSMSAAENGATMTQPAEMAPMARTVATQPAMEMKAEKTVEVDVAARYLLEQRRMDRAHQLSEMEEKLRQDTHKVFNPVWEVDRLQWPSVVDKLMQHRAESMAQVAAHMKAACQDGLSVLGVTSAGKGEGRTTVACCLARLTASHGLNVCLVDLDLDHPTLCIQTNMEVEHDWRDCLTDELTLEEVAVHSLEDHLTILPLKPRGGRPGLLASDSRLAEMLTELASSFELVIVDCAKVNSAGNVISGLTHASIFNAAILVVDRRDSQQNRIEDAVVSIQNSGIESIGIVDNFAM